MIIQSEMGQTYTIAKTLPGTCSYYNFTPISNTKIGTISEQLEYSFVFNFQTDEIIKECLFMNMSF